jgi:hypothetical protein
MNFTAPNDFSAPWFGTPAGSNSGTPQIISAGATGTYYVDFSYPSGSAATPITLQLLGAPAGAIASFNPEPAIAASTVTVATTSSTPPGAYTVSCAGTNSSGLTRICYETSTLLITG